MNTYAGFAPLPMRATKLARLYGLPVFRTSNVGAFQR